MLREKILKSMFFKLFISLVIIVVILTAYADTVPSLQTSGQHIADTGVPLGEFFNSSNVIMIIIMISLAMMIIVNMLKNGK